MNVESDLASARELQTQLRPGETRTYQVQPSQINLAGQGNLSFLTVPQGSPQLPSGDLLFVGGFAAAFGGTENLQDPVEILDGKGVPQGTASLGVC
jgi:hypothetical protein